MGLLNLSAVPDHIPHQNLSESLNVSVMSSSKVASESGDCKAPDSVTVWRFDGLTNLTVLTGLTNSTVWSNGLTVGRFEGLTDWPVFNGMTDLTVWRFDERFDEAIW
jgi:hypothetical protein